MQRFAHQGVVETKPARLMRRSGIGIDGNYFEISIVAELHQVVMGSHGFVQTAFGNIDTERRANVIDALLQGFCRNYQVVEVIHGVNLF